MNTKTIISSITAGLVLGGTALAGTTSGKGVTPTPPEEKSPLTGAVTLGYASEYEFRGLDLGDDLVSADLTLTYAMSDKLSLYAGAWYATLWDGDYNEIDLTAGASYDLGFGTGGLLYRHYLYDGDISDNNEIGLLFSTDADLLGGVSLSLGSYYDFEFDGFYFELGASYSRSLTDMIGLSLSTGVSYVVDYNGVDGDGFNHVFAQLALPITLRENVTLSPFIRATWAIEELEALGADDLVLGGANLTVTF
ncbi:MAG: hypothetical protein ACKO2G_13265 [Verrucomicrobiales bacterium]